MTAISTAAWVAHDLGIATGVGGTLFGRVALPPAIEAVSDKGERGSVMNTAWDRFNKVQVGALGLVALTWFTGRTQLSGSEVSSASRGLVIAKDVFVVGALASAIASGVFGRKLAEKGGPLGRVPIENRNGISDDAPDEAKALHKTVRGLGLVNLICSAGVVATTAILAMEAGRSGRFKLISRLLA